MSRRPQVGESHIQLRSQTFGATYGGVEGEENRGGQKKLNKCGLLVLFGKSRTRVNFPTLGLGGTLHTSARLMRSTTGGDNSPSTRCRIRDWSSESQARL